MNIAQSNWCARGTRPHRPGRIRDLETGRCLTILGCKLDAPYTLPGQPLDPNSNFGQVRSV
jgi:hypothetical protein